MAAQFLLMPPEGFDFAHPDSWTKWNKRFEHYRSASGLSERDKAVQVSELIYAMGDTAEEIFDRFGLSETDARKYDLISKLFQEHLIKRHNPIYEPARFNQLLQQTGESIDAFVTSLHSLAKHCE